LGRVREDGDELFGLAVDSSTELVEENFVPGFHELAVELDLVAGQEAMVVDLAI
jgi:hypothetical protein